MSLSVKKQVLCKVTLIDLGRLKGLLSECGMTCALATIKELNLDVLEKYA